MTLVRSAVTQASFASGHDFTMAAKRGDRFAATAASDFGSGGALCILRPFFCAGDLILGDDSVGGAGTSVAISYGRAAASKGKSFEDELMLALCCTKLEPHA